MGQKELDLLDKKLLHELDHDARAPISLIAKKIRASKETVAFRLKRLIMQKIIKGFVTTIHPSRLGSYYYKLFYRFHKTTPEVDTQIIEFISEYKQTAWFGRFEGPYEIAFLLIAQSFKDLEAFLTSFRENFGEYVLEQEIHVVTEVHRFSLKFFLPHAAQFHLAYPKEVKKETVDDKDRALVRLLANNARISNRELALKTKLDPSTTIYRMKKLRERQIIGPATIALNFDAFDLRHFQINFKLKNRAAVSKIINYFSMHVNATFATVTLGKYDLAVEMVVKDAIALRKILDELKKKYTEDIMDHDTFLITNEYVVTWFP